ncbi:MAG: sodium-extruding oxaloacetate decarboxylase subunit alpha [Magnetococcus sp. WYHC-3]
MNKPLLITDVVLRDAHQSLLATRMRIDDMLPIAAKLDQVGFWSLESWGGATFDACIRFLGEDPWERMRRLKQAMPKTRMQMLLRGQNILGYRHYADDVVERFVERAAENGVDVFRIFDAMNDPRNFATAVRACLRSGRHAQGTLSYTVSDVHTLSYWLDLARRLEDMGSHSICIKDMAGLLKPYVAFELVSRLKELVQVPIAMQTHATTGMSTSTILKAAEAGIDMVDTSISSLSMTYGHSATESVVAILQDTPRDTGLDILLLEDIAAYFREVRKKYAAFEGSLRGVDSRILTAQVPGGMLTNMESQLKQQGALDKYDAVLEEIPRVRKDLGSIALVTPTSQIVGTQAVLNVTLGRYKTISKEAAGVLKGEYGCTPAPVNAELQTRVLAGEPPMTCRPADLIPPEMDRLSAELQQLAQEKNIRLADAFIDDVLTYALFPQVGLKFLENRDNPAAFEPAPGSGSAASAPAAVPVATAKAPSDVGLYRVVVNGTVYSVEVGPEGGAIATGPAVAAPPAPAASSASAGTPLPSPLTGTVVRFKVAPGQTVQENQVVAILEAMKMETEVRTTRSGRVVSLDVAVGATIHAGKPLLTLA